MPFRTLLYRYFFFGWLFQDVCRGTPLQRAAAWRHNQAQARWLPTYTRRWAWCTVGLFALGGGVEQLLQAPGASAVFYVPCALSVAVHAVIGAAWVGFKRMPAPV